MRFMLMRLSEGETDGLLADIKELVTGHERADDTIPEGQPDSPALPSRCSVDPASLGGSPSRRTMDALATTRVAVRGRIAG